MKMKTVTSKGKRLDKLKELAKILATNIDECADVRALPQLAKQWHHHRGHAGSGRPDPL